MEFVALKWIVEAGFFAAALVVLVWSLKIHNDRKVREDAVADRLIDVIAQDASAKERLAGALDAVNDTIERKLRAVGQVAQADHTPRTDAGAAGATPAGGDP